MKEFIYVSFVTITPCHTLPKEMLRNLVEVFSKFPYKIVWKFKCDELPGKLDNAFISEWFLQRGVLGKIKSMKSLFLDGKSIYMMRANYLIRAAHPNIKSLFIKEESKELKEPSITWFQS